MTLLIGLKEKTNAKILILEPFLLPAPDKEHFRVDLNPKIDIIRKLAREFADYYIPLDGLFAQSQLGKEDTHWSEDGVHPNAAGSDFIGRIYADAFKEMMAK